jgi:Polyketide cyclase / dehydrase and lipid transport
MAFTERMQIACPQSKAFDLMADARNELKWNDDVSAVELRSDEPIGQGSTFIVVNRGREDEATITQFDRLERLAFAVASKQMDIDIRYTFEVAEGGTLAVGIFDAEPKGAMKFLMPLLMPLIKRGLAKQHANFIRLCETS